jgi:hypothetical protein
MYSNRNAARDTQCPSIWLSGNETRFVGMGIYGIVLRRKLTTC